MDVYVRFIESRADVRRFYCQATLRIRHPDCVQPSGFTPAESDLIPANPLFHFLPRSNGRGPVIAETYSRRQDNSLSATYDQFYRQKTSERGRFGREILRAFPVEI